MRKTLGTIIVTALLTFILTENYMLSTIVVSETLDGYMVTVFGQDFQQ